VREWMSSAPEPEERAFQAPVKSFFAEKAYADYAISVAGVPDASAIRVVADPGNGMAGLMWQELTAATGIKPIRMNFEPNGRFPAHEPNPSKLENLLPLRDRVVAEGADIGFAYDGDADRAVAVLADGYIMHGSEMIAAIVERLFEGSPPGRFAVNLVTSRKLLDFFRARGSEPVMGAVGHAKVKRLMRSDPTILFAGEQSGHYFYREFFCCESALITTLHLLHLAAAGRLQSLVEGLPGPWLMPAKEPSFNFADRDEAVAACRVAASEGLRTFPDPQEIACEAGWQVKRNCSAVDVEQADGIRVDYPDWWFCVRPSETEPLVRLTLEARTQTALQEKQAALSKPFT
jgi:phosphomannomutase